MRLRVWPPMLLVKMPPAKILPSACSAIAKQIVRVRVERISRASAASSRAMRLRVWPPMGVEIAARQNLAVSLHRDGIDSRSRSGRTRPPARYGIEPGNAIARLPPMLFALLKEPPLKPCRLAVA